MNQYGKNFCLLHLIFQEQYIIWSSFMADMYLKKDNISRHFFHFFVKILIFVIIKRQRGGGGGGLKGDEMAQNDQKFCLSHCVSQELYIIWLWFLVHTCEMMISPANFLFFKILIFGVFKGVLGFFKGFFSMLCSISQEL